MAHRKTDRNPLYVSNERLRYMRIGYTRVSKEDGSQSLDLQRDALGPGAVAWSPPGEPHGVANDTDGSLVLLVAVAPNPNRQDLPRYV